MQDKIFQQWAGKDLFERKLFVLQIHDFNCDTSTLILNYIYILHYITDIVMKKADKVITTMLIRPLNDPT